MSCVLPDASGGPLNSMSFHLIEWRLFLCSYLYYFWQTICCCCLTCNSHHKSKKVPQNSDMGQKHSKWSLNAKQKKSDIVCENYATLSGFEYHPFGQRSPCASVQPRSSNSTGITEGSTQLAEDQINPTISQEASPTEKVTEIQKIEHEVQLPGQVPPHLDNLCPKGHCRN